MKSFAYNLDVIKFVHSSYVYQRVAGRVCHSATFCADTHRDRLHHYPITSVTKWMERLAFVVVKSFELEKNLPTCMQTDLTRMNVTLINCKNLEFYNIV